MIFIIPHNQFIYQIYCSPTLFDKEPNIIGAILIIINFIVFTYLSYNPIKVGLLYDKPSDKYGIDTLNK